MAKMLEHVPVFIGNCNFHVTRSFCIISLAVGCDAGLSAVPAAAGPRGPVAQPVVPARDAQLLPVDEAIRNFKPGRFVHFGYGGSGNSHLPRALFMGLFFKVNQPDGFVFVHGQDNLFTV